MAVGRGAEEGGAQRDKKVATNHVLVGVAPKGTVEKVSCRSMVVS